MIILIKLYNQLNHHLHHNLHLHLHLLFLKLQLQQELKRVVQISQILIGMDINVLVELGLDLKCQLVNVQELFFYLLTISQFDQLHHQTSNSVETIKYLLLINVYVLKDMSEIIMEDVLVILSVLKIVISNMEYVCVRETL